MLVGIPGDEGAKAPEPTRASAQHAEDKLWRYSTTQRVIIYLCNIKVYFDKKKRKLLRKIYVSTRIKQRLGFDGSPLAIIFYFFKKITYHCSPPVQRSYGLHSHLEPFGLVRQLLKHFS